MLTILVFYLLSKLLFVGLNKLNHKIFLKNRTITLPGFYHRFKKILPITGIVVGLVVALVISKVCPKSYYIKDSYDIVSMEYKEKVEGNILTGIRTNPYYMYHVITPKGVMFAKEVDVYKVYIYSSKLVKSPSIANIYETNRKLLWDVLGFPEDKYFHTCYYIPETVATDSTTQPSNHKI